MTNPAKDPAGPKPEYTLKERRQLLQLAHDSIFATLEERDLDLTPPTDHLAQLRGAFTTLHLNQRLRGCIGYIMAAQPVWQTVAETARAAAFDDPRFDPVTPDEASKLNIEISVLSPMFPIKPEEVLVGIHGLLVTKGAHRGLLLPQVPTEMGWNRDVFLAQTCIKAGLPPDAWKTGATLQAFTAEVFGENDNLGRV